MIWGTVVIAVLGALTALHDIGIGGSWITVLISVGLFIEHQIQGNTSNQ